MARNTKIFIIIFLTVLLIFLYKQIQTETSSNPMQVQTEDSVSNTSKTLNLSNQNLEKLPSSVLSQTSLEELDISDNNISGALPAEIRHLQNLKILNARNNKMTGVPAEVGQLSKLEILDLSNNQLTGLPYELGNLKNLKKLILSGNDYSKQDLEVIKRSLPTNTEFLF